MKCLLNEYSFYKLEAMVNPTHITFSFIRKIKIFNLCILSLRVCEKSQFKYFAQSSHPAVHRHSGPT